MAVALGLALRGRGSVEPNPMVGAVVVRDGEVVGRGWHKRFGGPHAEIEAIRDTRAGGASTRGATMYVSLEPCCHTRKKTPPCTEAIVTAGLSCVVTAMEDPDPNVGGRGLARLRDAGVDVRCGVMGGEAVRILRAYVKLRRTGRPWVICKWAQTADGYLALPPGRGRWISGPESRRYVHVLRGVCDGVCVGSGTVLADDPLLTNRGGDGRQPARLVLDARLNTPTDCQLIHTSDRSPVLIATTLGGEANALDKAERLRELGAELVVVDAGQRGVDLDALLEELGRRNWTHLLVEGGAQVLRSFVDAGLADELMAFVAPTELGGVGGDLPHFDLADVARSGNLGEADEQAFGDDVLRHYTLTNPEDLL